MLQQFSQSLASWLALAVVLSIVGLVLLVKWKDRQIQRARVKLVEHDEDASNDTLERQIDAQRAKIGLDEKALAEAEVRMARALDSRPGSGSK